MRTTACMFFVSILLARPLLAGAAWTADALRPFVRVLTRPIDTYHCAPRARIGLPAAGAVAPQDSTLRLYLEEKLSRYWDASLPVRPYAIASGLYAGIDPVTCRHFAGVGEAWALVRIRLPKGLTFLDVRREQRPAHEQPRFPATVLGRINGEGCQATDPSSLVIAMDSQVCRDIALASLKELRVGAILADFPAFSFKQCDRAGNGVFILLDPVQTSLHEAVLFTKEVPPEDPIASERLRIHELYLLARQAGSTRAPLWPSLPGSVPTSEMKLWMDEHLWGCGPRLDEAPGLKR